MKSLYPLLALAALAACHKPQPHVIDTRPVDPNAAEIANRPMAALPPAIRAQKTYRCGDGSLAYVNWFVGDKTANVRIKESDPPIVLASTTGSSPWTSAIGWTLMGSDDDITLVQPGKSPRSCHT